LEDETASKWGDTTPRDGEQHAADAALKRFEQWISVSYPVHDFLSQDRRI
jgi:hypothetical protein